MNVSSNSSNSTNDIAVVSNLKSVSEIIADQIRTLIGDKFSLHPFSVENDLPSWDNFDLVLASSRGIANRIAAGISPDLALLVMDFTVSREKWASIMSVPAGTEALVVNDCYESTYETITLLYELGATHLTLSPCYPGLRYVQKIPVAQAMHNASPRCHGPFVAVNCAALPENLLESELFGYEEGSFTGALKGGKKGLFQQASSGTIFLDEIGDLPLTLQPRLLRVLQEKVVMPIGANRVYPIDVRVISATNQNLRQLVKEGKFREDLYFRLNVLPLFLPPLRERKEDILPLILHFMDNLSGSNSSEAKQRLLQQSKVMAALIRYHWPGNVRELYNCICYLYSLGQVKISPDCLPPEIKQASNFDDKEPQTNLDQEPADRRSVRQAIISILEQQDNGGMGRRSLTRVLQEEGWQITEHQVRKELAILARDCRIKVNRGRAGTELNV